MSFLATAHVTPEERRCSPEGAGRSHMAIFEATTACRRDFSFLNMTVVGWCNPAERALCRLL